MNETEGGTLYIHIYSFPNGSDPVFCDFFFLNWLIFRVRLLGGYSKRRQTLFIPPGKNGIFGLKYFLLPLLVAGSESFSCFFYLVSYTKRDVIYKKRNL